jgi:hypothetical protein
MSKPFYYTNLHHVSYPGRTIVRATAVAVKVNNHTAGELVNLEIRDDGQVFLPPGEWCNFSIEYNEE